MNKPSRFLLSVAALGLFLLTACGGSGSEETSSEITIPDAPDAAVETIARELSQGNGGILWKAMPTSYQSDINQIAQLAGTKVDPEVYNRSFALIGRLAEVADKQKEFILNTKIGGQQAPEEIAKVEAAWPSIIGFFRTIASSSIASSEGLQSFDGQAFADNTVSLLVKYSKDLAAISGEPNPLELSSVKVLESTGATAKLEMVSADGTVETGVLTKVENRWVPKEIAADWSTSIAEAKGKLEAITLEEMAQQKPQILGVITTCEGVLMQIEAAATQEQFDQALRGAMMPIMGLIMMQGGMGGGQQGAPSIPVAP